MNQQYKILATGYSPEGALTTNAVVLYAATPEEAYKIYREYDVQRYPGEDGKPGSIKAYKVELFTLAYKPVNVEDFTAMYDLV